MARRRRPALPENYVAFNVALYGRRGRIWTMTERGRPSLGRNRSALSIGPSAAWWNGDTLTLEIDEVAVPLPRRVRGRVTIHPSSLGEAAFILDGHGRHRWRPIAPAARAEVAFDAPGVAWRGHAYIDSNDGDCPIEDDFSSWHWSRTAIGAGPRVLYDVTRTDGSCYALALRFDPEGAVQHFVPPPVSGLPPSRWRVPQATLADAGSAPRLVRRLEDGPFYARSLIASRIDGEDAVSVHESLSLTRFRKAWVQSLLPFRMPRRGKGFAAPQL